MGTSSDELDNSRFEHDTVFQVKEKCLEQRKKSRNQETKDSDPCDACVELFHRAFKGDQEAWDALYETFYKFMHNVVLSFTLPHNLHTDFPMEFGDPRDVINDVLFKIAREAKKNPKFINSSTLSGILKFIKKSLIHRMIDISRRIDPPPEPIDDLQKPEIPAPDNSADKFFLYEALMQWGARHFNSRELRIFELRFLYDIPPRLIVLLYGEEFPDKDEVHKLIERVMHRLRNDPGLWNLLK